MGKSIIAIKKEVRDYTGLVNLGSHVYENMTDNPNFVTPTPTLAALLTAVTDVQAAIAVWGPVGNRGRHADLVDLRLKTVRLAQLLKSMSQYVSLTAQLIAGSNYEMMAQIIATSGFELKRAKSPQGMLQKVQNFRKVVSLLLNDNEVRMEWEAPLDTASSGNVKLYKIFKGVDADDFTTAELYDTTTQTLFIDTNNTGAQQTWTYWIVAVNAAGNGVTSDALTVRVIG